jgi:hypothetical protein
LLAILIPLPSSRYSPLLHREFDSTFAGSMWGDDRMKLLEMTASALSDYANASRLTEDFGYDISGYVIQIV